MPSSATTPSSTAQHRPSSDASTPQMQQQPQPQTPSLASHSLSSTSTLSLSTSATHSIPAFPPFAITISSYPDDPHRPQAGPLPKKRGEIGFQEGIHENAFGASSRSLVALPERHPADREDPPPSQSGTEPTTGAPPATPNITGTSSTSQPLAGSSVPSSDSVRKQKGLFGIFHSGFGGMRFTTLLMFTTQLLAISATIAIWILLVQRLARASNSVDADGNLVSKTGPTNAVFIHVCFSVVVIGQLLFIERRLYRLRAERYTYLHPGEILPLSRRHRGLGVASDPVIAFSPWNRPPLPTYAAALAQSGVGTGDVEDHLIAAPPPPAYGNTRGSVLLLAGHLRDSLLARRPLSVQSRISESGEIANSRSRPASYASQDPRWEEIQNADRAQRLEETLTRLVSDGHPR